MSIKKNEQMGMWTYWKDMVGSFKNYFPWDAHSVRPKPEGKQATVFCFSVNYFYSVGIQCSSLKK